MYRIQVTKRAWYRFRNPLGRVQKKWWFTWLMAAIPISGLDRIELLCASSAIVTFKEN